MISESLVLYAAAGAIGALHTLVGPDHYLPFIAMSRAGGWTLRKTTIVTILCGVGHVLGSLILGLLGIALGVAVFKLERLESIRNDLAGWMLIAFGVIYLTWGIRRAIRNHPHSHLHAHEDGIVHDHAHSHHREHVHVHANAADPRKKGDLTPWILFTIFVFGPCEPLIPLVMYPAARGHNFQVAMTVAAFGLATLGTMVSVVWLSCHALTAPKFQFMPRFGHAVAGLVILGCGIALKAGL